MVARISCPFSSFTLNIALDSASTIDPSCLMSACLAIDFGSAKIILLGERIKFHRINIRPRLNRHIERQKTLKKGYLHPAKVHFGHLAIEILEFMDPYRMVNMTPVFPIPDFKFTELVSGRDHQPEWSAHIFDRFVVINDLFKTHFGHLCIIQRYRIKIIWFKPVILVAVMDANLLVFMVNICNLAVKSLSIEIRLNNVSFLNVLKSDHIAFF